MHSETKGGSSYVGREKINKGCGSVRVGETVGTRVFKEPKNF